MNLEQARQYHAKYQRIGIRQNIQDVVIIWSFRDFDRILALYECPPEQLYFYEG
ncbi:hypothetical protein [Vibrio astriarenae]|uniref:hypothetical protein n=1 Tax=Vibrio astriarenae TaxID=1481923 RepID=UPI0037370986